MESPLAQETSACRVTTLIRKIGMIVIA